MNNAQRDVHTLQLALDDIFSLTHRQTRRHTHTHNSDLVCEDIEGGGLYCCLGKMEITIVMHNANLNNHLLFSACLSANDFFLLCGVCAAATLRSVQKSDSVSFLSTPFRLSIVILFVTVEHLSTFTIYCHKRTLESVPFWPNSSTRWNFMLMHVQPNQQPLDDGLKTSVFH